jgi:flagellar assembly protein FliH
MTRVIRAERRGPALIRAGTQLPAAGELSRAYAAAEAEGYAAGTARAARELLSISAARLRVLQEDREQLQRAALSIAGKLAQRELAADPALLAELIEPLVTRVRRAAHIGLRVHPDDALALGIRLADLAQRAELEGVLELIADPALERGDCVVESSIGELDARLATRLHELGRALGWETP